MALVLSAPLLAFSAVAIKLSSRGPVIFRAKRAGLRGEPFVMYKLRTMHPDTAREQSQITGGSDPRVFAAGRWIRRLKLDEIPQLVNVLTGEMAVIGPRPEAPAIVESHYSQAMRETLEVLPGIASPGSLSYFAGESRMPADPVAAEAHYVREVLPRKLALELVYVRNRSWRYDVQLAVRALAAVAGVRTVFPARQKWESREADRILNEWLAAPTSGSAI